MKEKGKSSSLPPSPPEAQQSQGRSFFSVLSSLGISGTEQNTDRNYKELELAFRAKSERRAREHVCLIAQFLLPFSLHISFTLLIH